MMAEALIRLAWPPAAACATCGSGSNMPGDPLSSRRSRMPGKKFPPSCRSILDPKHNQNTSLMANLMPIPTNSLIRVAVVEDKAAFRRGLQAILEMTPGIECVGMYSTGEEAVREVPKAAPDVILMD